MGWVGQWLFYRVFRKGLVEKVIFDLTPEDEFQAMGKSLHCAMQGLKEGVNGHVQRPEKKPGELSEEESEMK